MVSMLNNIQPSSWTWRNVCVSHFLSPSATPNLLKNKKECLKGGGGGVWLPKVVCSRREDNIYFWYMYKWSNWTNELIVVVHTLIDENETPVGDHNLLNGYCCETSSSTSFDVDNVGFRIRELAVCDSDEISCNRVDSGKDESARMSIYYFLIHISVPIFVLNS